jgi:hypothetical protein
MEPECVFCTVGTEFLNYVLINFRRQRRLVWLSEGSRRLPEPSDSNQEPPCWRGPAAVYSQFRRQRDKTSNVLYVPNNHDIKAYEEVSIKPHGTRWGWAINFTHSETESSVPIV